MPRGDGTGPTGAGPRTGRGMGTCTGTSRGMGSCGGNRLYNGSGRGVGNRGTNRQLPKR